MLRAKALQEYLNRLAEVWQGYRAIPVVALWVFSEGDWRAKLRQPYGFPSHAYVAAENTAFTSKKTKSEAAVYAAKFYPDRFLWRLREVLLPAAKMVGGLPGSIGEFVDLTLGREYARTLASEWKLRTRGKVVDEAIASYLFLLALRSAYPELYAKAKGWAVLLSQLVPSHPEDEEGKARGYTDQLWFQGQAMLRAVAWIEAGGDRALQEMLAAAPLSKKSAGKLLENFDGVKA
jgi:hypothetical protein